MYMVYFYIVYEFITVYLCLKVKVVDKYKGMRAKRTNKFWPWGGVANLRPEAKIESQQMQIYSQNSPKEHKN